MASSGAAATVGFEVDLPACGIASFIHPQDGSEYLVDASSTNQSLQMGFGMGAPLVIPAGPRTDFHQSGKSIGTSLGSYAFDHVVSEHCDNPNCVDPSIQNPSSKADSCLYRSKIGLRGKSGVAWVLGDEAQSVLSKFGDQASTLLEAEHRYCSGHHLASHTSGAVPSAVEAFSSRLNQAREELQKEEGRWPPVGTTSQAKVSDCPHSLSNGPSHLSIPIIVFDMGGLGLFADQDN